MEWSVEQRNAEDGPEVTAAMVAGDTALILRCKDQNTEAAFSTKYNYLGSKSVNILVQINDQEPNERSMVGVDKRAGGIRAGRYSFH